MGRVSVHCHRLPRPPTRHQRLPARRRTRSTQRQSSPLFRRLRPARALLLPPRCKPRQRPGTPRLTVRLLCPDGHWILLWNRLRFRRRNGRRPCQAFRLPRSKRSLLNAGSSRSSRRRRPALAPAHWRRRGHGSKQRCRRGNALQPKPNAAPNRNASAVIRPASGIRSRRVPIRQRLPLIAAVCSASLPRLSAPRPARPPAGTARVGWSSGPSAMPLRRANGVPPIHGPVEMPASSGTVRPGRK